jgi:hypothetical protein
MKRLLIIAAVLTGQVGNAHAQTQAPEATVSTGTPAPSGRYETGPSSWARMPTGVDLARVFPRKAIKSNRLVGSASVECAVSQHGKLRNCTVVQEEPSGFGYGEAVLKLVPLFTLKASERPLVGNRTVVMPVTFRGFPE